MIKGIILDIDGVIIGKKKGYNFPKPHPDVIKKLKEIQQSGIPITLCSAKAYFAFEDIIKAAELDTYHVADGGALIIDAASKRAAEEHILDSTLVDNVISKLNETDTYIELYTFKNWYVREGIHPEWIESGRKILQREPIILVDLLEDLNTKEVTKLIAIIKDEKEREYYEKGFDYLENKIKLSWTTHPLISPAQILVITPQGISKRSGTLEISKLNNISLNNYLGVGDTISDWQFLEFCGFKAAMGNSTNELNELFRSEAGENCYIGKHVDENGVLDIFSHFGL